MAVSKEGKAAAPAGGGPRAAQEEDEFSREIKITRPFDMKPVADGTASVLDEKVQEEICRFVTGTVRLASRKFVIPDVLIFFNGGVRWLYTTVLCGDGIPPERISRWESVHHRLKEELCRYCAEQARNALVVGSDEAAKLWLSAKSKVEQIHAIHYAGDLESCPLSKSNESFYDVSVDENGHARLEKASFDAYNECTVLKDVVERYKERTGRYPKRVLVDQVYRTKENRSYCEERGIEMSGRGPGRPPKDGKERRKAEKDERKNDVDRIEVERFFSRDKRCFGAGLVMTKLSNTTLGSIALAVLVANLFGAGLSFFAFYFVDAPDGVVSFDLVEVQDDAA